ncbi:MAG: 6-carboxytetrahydropterin synthase [Thermoleophilia bacterium]|nr:6-carboxytetrahydropterin synthase [Thermoleophilia bacterium]
MMTDSMATYKVRRGFSFESAHQLPEHPTCSVIHGHSYRGEIEISAGKLSSNGFVIDFGVLKDITAPYDHAKILTQTAEELAAEIGTSVLRQMEGQDNRSHLISVRVILWETANACAEWEWHVQDK